MECLLCRWTQKFSSRYTVSLTLVERCSFLWLASVWLVACRFVVIRTFGVLVVHENDSARYGFGPERLMRAFVYVALYLEKI